MIKIAMGSILIILSQCFIINTQLTQAMYWMIPVSVVMLLAGMLLMILRKEAGNEEASQPVNTLEMSKEEISNRYKYIKKLIKKFPPLDKGCQEECFRKENLVITDLFVEKDIALLTTRAEALKKEATRLYMFAIIVFTVGTVIAFCNMFYASNEMVFDIYDLLPSFTKSFTAYGLLVFTGVALWKHSKAKFDQAERIFEKRRTDRLLRLFIHLNAGKITFEEMEKLLSMGGMQKNAFSDVKAEGKAPFGALFANVMQNNQALTEKILELVKKSEESGTGRKGSGS